MKQANDFASIVLTALEVCPLQPINRKLNNNKEKNFNFIISNFRLNYKFDEY